MNFLKPIFFSKYKPTTVYQYPDWENTSFDIKGQKMAMYTKETEKEAKGVVVLVHPQLVEAKQYFINKKYDDLYLNMGMNVVIFDFNGFGESEDRGFAFDEDVHEVIKVVNKKYPNLAVLLHGVSFGGSQLITGTLKDESLVDAIIIESAISSTEEYYKHRAYNFQYRVLKMVYALSSEMKAQSIYTDLIKQLKNTPVLFIYGHQDIKTPMWMGEKLYDNANEPKILARFDTKHLTTYEEEPERYVSTISRFLNTVM